MSFQKKIEPNVFFWDWPCGWTGQDKTILYGGVRELNPLSASSLRSPCSSRLLLFGLGTLLFKNPVTIKEEFVNQEKLNYYHQFCIFAHAIGYEARLYEGFGNFLQRCLLDVNSLIVSPNSFTTETIDMGGFAIILKSCVTSFKPFPQLPILLFLHTDLWYICNLDH